MMEWLRSGFRNKKAMIVEDFAEWLLVAIFIIFGLILLFAITSFHQKKIKDRFENLEKDVYVSQLINMELKRRITYGDQELSVAEALGLLGDIRQADEKAAESLAEAISKKLSFGHYSAVICFSDLNRGLEYNKKNCYNYMEGLKFHTSLSISGLLDNYEILIGFADIYGNFEKNIVYKS